MIIIKKLKLGYQQIPKVASTSLFLWLYQCCEGDKPESKVLIKGRQREYFLKPEADSGVSLLDNSHKDIFEYEDYFRFAITRDPIKRFLSMYSGRVVNQRELSRQSKSATRLEDASLPFDPQINELVDKFDRYLENSTSIRHHAIPMMNFLGTDLTVYSRIADIGDIDIVINEIRGYWVRKGMHKQLELSPAKQSSGPKIGLHELHPDSFEKLLDYYKEDFEKIPTISLRGIKDEYFKARKDNPNLSPVSFPPVSPVSFPPLSKIKRRPLRPAKNENCNLITKSNPLVEVVKVKLPTEGIRPNLPFSLKGTVLMKPEFSSGNWRLHITVAKDDDIACQWGLPSPNLASKYPKHPDAARARFKANNLKIALNTPVQLVLEDGNGARNILFELVINN
jgi:hypothetical protein